MYKKLVKYIHNRIDDKARERMFEIEGYYHDRKDFLQILISLIIRNSSEDELVEMGNLLGRVAHEKGRYKLQENIAG